jgi:23S rRNA (adenine2030-N6)-methyltransferase
VPPPRSRYQPDAAPDYSHRFHAGNVGDVWKHCALVEVLRLAAAAAPSVAYVESHAGEGSYELGPTGEWTEGVGRLWTTSEFAARDDAAGRYVPLCRRLGSGTDRPTRYPGSPQLARAVLGPAAPLILRESDAAAYERLVAAMGADPHVEIAREDGLATLPEVVRATERRAGAVVVLIDPPYSRKADWTQVPDALVRAATASARACLLLWYPVKSLTRPNAMIARVEAAGVSGAVAELITTPLAHQRHRLNGSGVLVVRPPAGALEALAAAAPVIGRRCATHGGAWSFRMQSWGPSAGGEQTP